MRKNFKFKTTGTTTKVIDSKRNLINKKVNNLFMHFYFSKFPLPKFMIGTYKLNEQVESILIIQFLA